MTIEAERRFVTWFRSGVDGQDHAVTDEANALAHERKQDAEAICGQLVTPVPLTVPPGPRCRACERYVRARATLRNFDARRDDRSPRRKPSFPRRLFTRALSPGLCHQGPVSKPLSLGPLSPGPLADPLPTRQSPVRIGQGPHHGGPVETPTSGGAAVHHSQGMIMVRPLSSEEAPHIAALRRAAEAGFRFQSLGDEHGIAVAALYGERWCRYGVVETITMRGMYEAIAARIRVEDYPSGDPVWQLAGTVAEVIHELLALPAHGFPSAPTLARRDSSSLWLPGSA